ncbi:MAG TPA: TetR/AcrR family transcriptional regulator [Spirochaetota bacterium]|jgi:AcrR family transcriptional regulator|nr:TetR/AcrR family transcriptional regulator [Spirochaetota bacterium]OQA98795.1 MAG: HTH-type transcriptional regulator AcrR [Spirochaetes bacterium ADurb.Bin218]HOK03218.1 TetR/AcrR family transcriptional regulator [Spirochaetota bacterium]HOK93532.1 TetR/AcrR family transcriptional regulator [Spirochaetota bacterium]HON15384.1 TetR/AcrR family transcriptional regulator [Spirochaetota bacterium]
MTEPTKFTDIKEQERIQKRNLILDVAEKVFSQKTFDDVNMRELAREVGISPGAIYTYFPDKESLYVAVSLRGFQRAVDIMREMINSGDDTLDKIAVRYMEEMIDNYDYMRIVQHCIMDGKFKTEESIEQLKEISRELFSIFDSILLKEIDVKNIRPVTHLIFSVLNGIVFTFGKYPGRTREEGVEHMKKLARLFIALLNKGI